MIYFDNAATSFPKPPQVGEAMVRFLNADAANPGRAGLSMAFAAERMLDEARLKLTRLFNGREPERMILTLNTTDALNIAIKGVVGAAPAGLTPHVITTVLEHNSVSRPLQALADGGRIELTRVVCDAMGFVDPGGRRRLRKLGQGQNIRGCCAVGHNRKTAFADPRQRRRKIIVVLDEDHARTEHIDHMRELFEACRDQRIGWGHRAIGNADMRGGKRHQSVSDRAC